MGPHPAAEDGTVFHLDMASQTRQTGHNDMISQHTIVGDMGL
jgi:hypothetical protein